MRLMSQPETRNHQDLLEAARAPAGDEAVTGLVTLRYCAPIRCFGGEAQMTKKHVLM